MQLTEDERQGVETLINDERSPGMIIWLEEFEDDDTTATGCAQGDSVEIIMMTIQAIDFAARSLDMTPKQVLKKIANFISATKHKPSDTRYELCNFK